MKKKILALAVFTVSASASFAAPVVIGDVKLQDKRVIFDGSIVCTAYSTALKGVRAETLVYGSYTTAVSKDGSILLTGILDNEIFTISGNPNQSLNIRMQERGTSAPAYSFMSSGRVSDLVVDGEKLKGADLVVTLNGRSKNIGCNVRSK